MNTNTFRSRSLLSISILIILALAIGGLVAAGIVSWPGRKVLGAEKIPLKIAGQLPPISLEDFKNGYASAIDPALPAVVNISTTTVVKRQNNVPGFFSDPFFRQFFGGQFEAPSTGPQTERENALGSGVIVNPDDYVLTNNHVVSGATDIQVFTTDKRQFKAKVIGADPRTDVAVVKIDASGLPALTLGDSEKLKVGDLVFAIGDPMGVGETATTGIVSAVGRGLGGAIERYESFIQTDAAINLGNSGGALIDVHGDLIGINTAIVTQNGGGNQGNDIIRVWGLALQSRWRCSFLCRVARHLCGRAKDLSDLVHSRTVNRTVFIKRLRHVAQYPHRLLVVGSTLSQVKSPYTHTRVDPNRVMQFLIAVLAGLQVPFVNCESHELGEELVASNLYQAHLYHWLESNDYGRFLSDRDL